MGEFSPVSNRMQELPSCPLHGWTPPKFHRWACDEGTYLFFPHLVAHRRTSSLACDLLSWYDVLDEGGGILFGQFLFFMGIGGCLQYIFAVWRSCGDRSFYKRR